MATALPGSIEWYQQQGYNVILPTAVPSASSGVTLSGQPIATSTPTGTVSTGLSAVSITGGIIPTTQAAAPLVGSVVAVITSILGSIGIKQLLKYLAASVGFSALWNAVKDVFTESGQQSLIETTIATLIPGQQAFLDEFPAGMGELGGRIVRTWAAGGAKVYFCMVEKPTRSGSSIVPYVYSAKRSAWLPFSFPRNVVFGRRELDVAAALSGKKRISKKRALRALAGTNRRRATKKEDC